MLWFDVVCNYLYCISETSENIWSFKTSYFTITDNLIDNLTGSYYLQQIIINFSYNWKVFNLILNGSSQLQFLPLYYLTFLINMNDVLNVHFVFLLNKNDLTLFQGRKKYKSEIRLLLKNNYCCLKVEVYNQVYSKFLIIQW